MHGCRPRQSVSVAVLGRRAGRWRDSTPGGTAVGGWTAMRGARVMRTRCSNKSSRLRLAGRRPEMHFSSRSRLPGRRALLRKRAYLPRRDDGLWDGSAADGGDSRRARGRDAYANIAFA